MIAGLIVRDSSGVITNDLTTSNGLVISSVQSGYNNGSHYDDRLLGGNPFVILSFAETTTGRVSVFPAVTVSDGTIYWEFPEVSNPTLFPKVNTNILYGIS